MLVSPSMSAGKSKPNIMSVPERCCYTREHASLNVLKIRHEYRSYFQDQRAKYEHM